MKKRLFWVLILALHVLGCQDEGQEVASTAPMLEVERVGLTGTAVCTGQFHLHELDHITTNQIDPVDMYDSNGSGLAINDLDNDGDLDIVLANLAGRNSIFWNEGGLNFRKEEMPLTSSRAVAIVDVDADGWQDIVFTTRVGRGLNYWRNLGNGQFETTLIQGIDQFAYAMAWGDMDKDGDLDVVTGSYDTALDKELRDSFMFGPGAGVFYFENQGNLSFMGERLIDTSQALAIQLLDLNGDGRLDILVGNDFDSVQDNYWLQTAAGWEAVEPFASTTQNTMSFDVGDVDNNGNLELFAADMHPYAFDDATNAAWAPVMEGMIGESLPGDLQIMENVMQTADANGQFSNVAHDLGTAYTGWSWSSKFGDLDQDGFLDLYVVNGMMTSSTFGHLDNYELIEENQVLQNNGQGQFVLQPNWNLNQTAGGRSMSMGDLDNDGDLDIVINNLLSPSVILENQLCKGSSIQVDLQWQNSQNPNAIGTVVTLQSADGFHKRDVRVSSGYLSGDPSRLHFGFPQDSQPFGLIINWPDGQLSHVRDLEPNQLIKIIREQ